MSGLVGKDPYARKLSRSERRKLRRSARAAAALLADGCIDYDAKTLRKSRVKDLAAKAALARAFEMLIVAGGEPQVCRISIDAAQAFPGSKAVDVAPEMKAWLGVGLDRRGHATYRVRMFAAKDVSPVVERYIAESIVLAELDRELRRPGFPHGLQVVQ